MTLGRRPSMTATVIDLSVTEALPALPAALAAGCNAVLVASPGGQPPSCRSPCLTPSRRGNGRILMPEARHPCRRTHGDTARPAGGPDLGYRAPRRRRFGGNPRQGHHGRPAAPPPAGRSGAGGLRRARPAGNIGNRTVQPGTGLCRPGCAREPAPPGKSVRRRACRRHRSPHERWSRENPASIRSPARYRRAAVPHVEPCLNRGNPGTRRQRRRPTAERMRQPFPATGRRVTGIFSFL
jgi:hypothetical protein